MTVDELRNQIWAVRVAQKEAEIVSLLTDLNVAQQRIKALEEAMKLTSKDPLKKKK